MMLIFSFPVYEHAPRVGMLCPHCWDLVPYPVYRIVDCKYGVLLGATGNTINTVPARAFDQERTVAQMYYHVTQ